MTAALVSALIYFAVFEREQLLNFAGVTAPGDPAAAAQSGSSADVAAEQEPDAAPDPAATAERPEHSPFAVVVRRIMQQDIDDGVLVRGRTEATRRVEVRAEVTGLVESDPLPRGAEVAPGDLMCELASGTRNAALAEAEARLAEAQIAFRAADRLSQDGFASESRAAGARAALQAAEAGVERAREDIARLRITAPIAGILAEDAAERGTLLQAGGLCGTVVQLDPIRLVGYVPELRIDRVQEGARAGARLATGREVLGTVSFVSRVADPATRTFRVEIRVANPDLAIRDGLSAEILIQAQGNRGSLVPASALTLDNDGRLGLRTVNDADRVVFVPVTVLRDERNGVWVSGLPDGARVIVIGQDYVVDGVPVRPVDEDDPAVAGMAPATASAPDAAASVAGVAEGETDAATGDAGTEDAQ
jgi:multidrug efflux system membrane fusion protein